MIMIFGATVAPPEIAQASAETGPPIDWDGISFEVDTDEPEAGATVIDYYGPYGSKVKIPHTIVIDGTEYPVRTIGETAFANQGLTEVDIPDSVETILRGAFGSNSLTSVAIPDSVITLEPMAFAYNELVDVTLSASLTELNESTFYWNKIRQITIPESVQRIGEQAFAENDLYGVAFLGDAPRIAAASEWGSFGPRRDQVLTSSPCATGFTAPNWQGYVAESRSTPLAVAFDSVGGSPIPSAKVELGCSVALPEPPTYDGFRFDGWYSDANVVDLYDFGSRVTASMTLYAGWTPVATHTVRFDSMGGSAVEPIEVQDGSVVSSPADPQLDGYNFTGWDTTQAGGTAYDFAKSVSQSFTLYAAWSPAKTITPGPPVVTPPTETTPPATTPPPAGKLPPAAGSQIGATAPAISAKASVAATKSQTLARTGGPSVAGLAWGGAGILAAGLTLLAIRRASQIRARNAAALDSESL